MPLVKAKLAMETLAPGEELAVLATDPEASIDLAAWAADGSHDFEEHRAAGHTEYRLKRAS